MYWQTLLTDTLCRNRSYEGAVYNPQAGKVKTKVGVFVKVGMALVLISLTLPSVGENILPQGTEQA